MGKGGLKHSINQSELFLKPGEYRLSLLFREIHRENVLQATVHQRHCGDGAEGDKNCSCIV